MIDPGPWLRLFKMKYDPEKVVDLDLTAPPFSCYNAGMLIEGNGAYCLTHYKDLGLQFRNFEEARVAAYLFVPMFPDDTIVNPLCVTNAPNTPDQVYVLEVYMTGEERRYIAPVDKSDT